MSTQRFSLVIRRDGETIVRGVEWSLHAVIRKLLEVELLKLSFAPSLSWQIECEGHRLDQSLTVGEALAAVGVTASTERPLHAIVQQAPSPYPSLESSAPSAPAMRPSAPSPFAGAPPPSPSFAAPPRSSFGVPAAAPGYAQPPPPTMAAASRPQQSSSPLDQRRATVRYFSRMNPQRVFPLVVTIAPYAVLTPLGPEVARAVSGAFAVDHHSLVEIEPVLPGCTCHPAKLSIDPRAGTEMKADFWVVPQVMGRVSGAEVYVRHGKRTVRVPLKVDVVEPRAARVTGVLSLALPYLSAVMKHYHVDFETQLSEGFSLYLTFARAFFTLGPTQLFALLLCATGGLWWWSRPRQAEAHDDPEKLLASPS